LHSGKVGKICVAYIQTVSEITGHILCPSPLTTVAVGSAAKGEESSNEHEHLEALKMALLRLPKVHLYVLDAIVLHLKTSVPHFLYRLCNPYCLFRLMDTTDVEESDEVYVTKLALSLGRSEFLLLYVCV
jgi:hypothetical protein